MKKKVMLNVGCTMLCQLVTFISGLIVPRLILSTFGSEANGLVSSIMQFLNYIALVEGGIGSVVLTALYGPLAKKDDRKISSVLKAAENFFRQIASSYNGDLYLWFTPSHWHVCIRLLSNRAFRGFMWLR